MNIVFRSLISALVLAFVSVQEAKADGNVVLGALSCTKTGPGVTYFVYSSIPVSCTYNGVNGPQTFSGTRGILFGVDLEIETEEGISYLVIGGTNHNTNSLAGTYVGARASAAFGFGPAVQAGLAGAGNDFVLVTVGLGGQLGIGLSAGISYLTIDGSK